MKQQDHSDINFHESARIPLDFIFILILTFCFTMRPYAGNIVNRRLNTDTIKLPDKQMSAFGFKNLFNQFSYNPSIPYDKQINPNAELYMRDYLRIHKSELLRLKQTGGIYFDMIDQVLSQYQLPHELKYLAVIESHLKTGATSWVGAAGPWQFMPETAKRYGLTVNAERDDRRDFFTSTHAAAKMLQELFSIYNDWLLVIAAYNGGPGRVNQAIEKCKSNNFWKLQHHLPEESRNHVKKFIATHYVMESDKIDFAFENQTKANENRRENMQGLLTEKIKGKFLSHIIIQELSISSNSFDKLNPDFDKIIRTSNQYSLTLPEDIMLCFIEKKQDILRLCMSWLMNQE